MQEESFICSVFFSLRDWLSQALGTAAHVLPHLQWPPDANREGSAGESLGWPAAPCDFDDSKNLAIFRGVEGKVSRRTRSGRAAMVPTSALLRFKGFFPRPAIDARDLEHSLMRVPLKRHLHTTHQHPCWLCCTTTKVPHRCQSDCLHRCHKCVVERIDLRPSKKSNRARPITLDDRE
jgi:hypothetical protein